MEDGRVSPGVGRELNMSSGMPSESQSPGPVLAGLSFNDTVKGAASLTARVALYPSLLYNLARSQLQDNWHWFDKVTENIILGALPFGSMLETFQDKGIKAVVTLNEEFEVFISTRQYQEIGINHLHIPTVDYLYAPPVEDLHRGVAFIAEHAERGELTYVHCKAGRGRSTTLVICYLIRQMRMSPEAAYEFVRTKRPQVCLAEGQWAAVREFHRSCLEARAADPVLWLACTDKLVESKAAELIDISGRRSPAGHARSASASDSSGASETCAAALAVDPLVGISRVDSPSCVSSHPIHSSSEGSPAPDQDIPAALPEPMVITVEGSAAKAQEGEVPVMHVPAHQPYNSPSSCGTQDVDIVEAHPEASCPATSSSGQAGRDQGSQQQEGSAAQPHAAGQQAGSSGPAEQGCGIADRLRAAVASRGFEPCPPGTDSVATCAGQSCSQTERPSADDPAAEQTAEQGLGTAMLCHLESETGQQQQQQHSPSLPSRGHERPGRLCQKDLHDLEREEAEQSASKKRRAEISSFSIAAQLSCDDLSRAGTETEGMIDDQLHSRSEADEACCEGMELEREDSRFHEWAAIDRNGSVVSLGR